MTHVNVLCMKWGTLYGPHYVNKLYAMVRRHLTLPFTFHCLTDDASGITSDVVIHPLNATNVVPGDLVMGWRKLAALSPELSFSGKVLFLDLDLIIVDNIDSFFTFSDKFCIIENWTQPGRGIGNSSVYCFEAGKYDDIFEAYKSNPVQAMASYANEQVFVSLQVGPERITYWPKEWCVSFKHHCLGSQPKWRRLIKTPSIPPGVKIIVFHGLPKPEHALSGVWPGLWPPYMHKALWIADHWG